MSGRSVFILITQCLQNGFFLADESRLCLPGDVAMRILVGMQQPLEEVYTLLPDEATKQAHELMQRTPNLGLEDAFNQVRYNFERRLGRVSRDLANNILSAERQEVLRTVFSKQYRLQRKRDNAGFDMYNRRYVDPELIKNGPLHQFLHEVIDDNSRETDLHVIHIKDWHFPSERYDEERRLYGTHCEAGTWEAEPIDGLESYLRPWGDSPVPDDGFRRKTDEKTVFYEIRSDSVYDFRPTINEVRAASQKKVRSKLEKTLDKLLLGIDEKGNEIEGFEKPDRAYVAVIGVYTDIKIRTLLMGLRTRYLIDNLVISDVLTDSLTVERHLEGMDFANKVLNVEVIHSLNELRRFLYPGTKVSEGRDIAKELISSSINFRDYRTYFLDKQMLLGYQDAKLSGYLQLTSQRAAQVYTQTFEASRYLVWIGRLSLFFSFFFAGLLFMFPDYFRAEFLLITGGLSLVQFVPLFINGPLNRMQQSLNNLVRLRNYLETYSLITALMRHHFTAPEHLADRDLNNLKTQMTIIQDVAQRMSANFHDIQLAMNDVADQQGQPTGTAGASDDQGSAC